MKELLFTVIDGGHIAFFALEKMNHSIDACLQFLSVFFLEDDAKFQVLVLSKNQNGKTSNFREKFPRSLVKKTLGKL